MTTQASEAGPALDDDQLQLLDAWWRAANYLAVGQIYLLDNPLLERGRWWPRTSSPGSSGTGGPLPASTSSTPT